MNGFQFSWLLFIPSIMSYIQHNAVSVHRKQVVSNRDWPDCNMRIHLFYILDSIATCRSVSIIINIRANLYYANYLLLDEIKFRNVRLINITMAFRYSHHYLWKIISNNSLSSSLNEYTFHHIFHVTLKFIF